MGDFSINGYFTWDRKKIQLENSCCLSPTHRSIKRGEPLQGTDGQGNALQASRRAVCPKTSLYLLAVTEVYIIQ